MKTTKIKNKTNRKRPFKKRIEDKKHLAYVRTLPCFIQRAGYYSCQGNIEAHHLLKPESGFRGFGLKAHDSECIPLCRYHHAQLHTKFGNEHKFFQAYGIPKDAGIKYAKKLYERTLDNDNNDLPF